MQRRRPPRRRSAGRRDAEAQAQAAELRLASALASEAAEREAADARRQHDAKRLAAVEHELSTARAELRAARDATMLAEMRERAAQAEAEGMQDVRLSRLPGWFRSDSAALEAVRQHGDDSHAAIEELRATAAERSRLAEERMRQQAADERTT